MKNRTLRTTRIAAAASLFALFAVAPARADVGMVSIRLNLEGCPT